MSGTLCQRCQYLEKFDEQLGEIEEAARQGLSKAEIVGNLTKSVVRYWGRRIRVILRQKMMILKPMMTGPYYESLCSAMTHGELSWSLKHLLLVSNLHVMDRPDESSLDPMSRDVYPLPL
ncbi:hypothetical protein HAX54_001729 [Datura stramonium]|uniref:Uncharacterized protein n=1 Tax=Datura stramonium TaxID=4076 RepID=A0ABS8WTA8_DATST|nr:hypothetical protein [Datura stramonium]